MAKKGIGEDTLEDIEEVEEVEETEEKTYKYRVSTNKVIFKGKVYKANSEGVVELPQQNIKGLRKA